MRMAKRTRPCNCWARRWRWPSRAASSALFVDEGVADGRDAIGRSGCTRGIARRTTLDRLLAAFAQFCSSVNQQSEIRNPQSKMVEPLSQPRVGNPAADRPGTLEPGDRRAAFPGPGHGQRAQPQDLRQTPGAKPHRSHRPRPRAGSVVAEPRSLEYSPLTVKTTPPINTKVSIRQHRAGPILLVHQARGNTGYTSQS